MGVLKCGSSVGAIIMVLVGLSPVIPLVGLVVSNAVLTIRAPFGATGADHMGNVLCFSALLAAIVPSPLATTACLGFIALQASLAYVTAGMGKIDCSNRRARSSGGSFGSTSGFRQARARVRRLSRSIQAWR